MAKQQLADEAFLREGLNRAKGYRQREAFNRAPYEDWIIALTDEIERLTRELDMAEKLCESLQNKWASRPFAAVEPPCEHKWKRYINNNEICGRCGSIRAAVKSGEPTCEHKYIMDALTPWARCTVCGYMPPEKSGEPEAGKDKVVANLVIRLRSVVAEIGEVLASQYSQ